MSELRPLRIWQMLDSYPPAYGGGANLVVRSLCRFLAEQGHEVRVLCVEATDQPPFTIRTDYDGAVRVDRVNLPYFGTQDPEGWRLGWSGWRAHQRKIAEFLETLLVEWTPDLVHYHVLRPFAEQCLRTLSTRKIPIVATAHDAWLICQRMYLLRSPGSVPCSGPGPLKCLSCVYSHYDGSSGRALVKLPWRLLRLGGGPALRLAERASARRLLSGLTVCADWLTEAHRGHVSGRVEYLPVGIELTGKPAAIPERPRRPLRFGFVGGFQAHKGLDDVLQACTALRRTGLDFELHVWGPPEGSRNAITSSEALTNCLTVHGIYDPADRWSVYAQMDVLVMATTVVETYGLVVQEARASGAPTIAPDIGGLAEQIQHDVDGLLYRFRDPLELEHQMRRVLTEPELLAKLLENQPQPLSREVAVAEMEAFYRRVLQDVKSKAAA